MVRWIASTGNVRCRAFLPSQKGTRSGKVAFLTMPRGVGGIGFPEICSQLLFPEIGIRGWGNGNGRAEPMADFGKTGCLPERQSLGACGRPPGVTEPAAVAAGPRAQEPIGQRLSGSSAALLGGSTLPPLPQGVSHFGLKPQLADYLPELSTAACFTPRIVPLHSDLAADRSRSRLKANHGVINVLRRCTGIERCDPVPSKVPDIGLLVFARRLGPSPSHVLKLALCSAPGAPLTQSQRFVEA